MHTSLRSSAGSHGSTTPPPSTPVSPHASGPHPFIWFQLQGKAPASTADTVTVPATWRLHYSQPMIVVMLGDCVEPVPQAQISWFSSPASTVTATAQEGIAPGTKGEIDTGLGRKSPPLGGGKQASCPCPSGFGRCTPLCSQGSCRLAASNGIKGSSRERILVRQRNPFSDHSQCNNSKEGTKPEPKSENRSTQGSTAVVLH